MSIHFYQLLILVCILVPADNSGAVPLLHDEDEGEPIEMTFRVNSRSEVDIGVDTWVGSILVEKGKYTIGHSIEAEKHIIVLSPLNRKQSLPASPGFRFDSTLLPFKEAVKRTILIVKEGNDHKFHLLSFQLVGENGDHLLH